MKKIRTTKIGIAIAIIIVLAVAFFWMNQRQYTMPDTPAGNRLTEIVSVVNSGNYTSIKSYIMENLTDEYLEKTSINDILNALMDIHFTSDHLEFIKYTDSPLYHIKAIFRNRLMDNYVELGLRVEKQPPYRIDETFKWPYEYSDREMDEAEAIATFKSLLDRLTDANVFSGTVLIAKNDKIIFQEAYGYADRDAQILNENHTRFNVASLGKMFTAVAIGQLVEKGNLSYEDSIDMYLGSDWINSEIGEKVKIKHLLTHTSGLGDFMKYINNMDTDDQRFIEFEALFNKSLESLDNYQPFLVDEYLRFEPGTIWSYSNTGFLLLDAIIEKVTEQSYDRYIDKNIFKPSNMVGGFNLETRWKDFPAPDFASGYSKEFSMNGTIWKNNPDPRVMQFISRSPAGGGFLNTEDLFKFSVALKENKLITEETKNILMSPKPMLNSPFYGYGFGIKEKNKEIIVGHTGLGDGSATMEMSSPNKQYTLIMLSNYDDIVFLLIDKFWGLVL